MLCLLVANKRVQ